MGAHVRYLIGVAGRAAGAESFEARLSWANRSREFLVIKRFLKTRVVDPIIALLTQGITPKKIALSVAFGVVVGCFPLLGTTTGLCVLAAMAFGLNLPAIQLVNYLVYPLQILLLIPFIRLGEVMMRTHTQGLTAAVILHYAKADLHTMMSKLGLAAAHAVAGWLLVAPLAFVLIYAGVLPLVTRLAKNRAVRISSDLE